MKSLSFEKMMSSISKRLQARVELSGVYSHPSGTGDDREYAVMDVLQEVLPERFGLDKGRVFDSEGNVSAEIDIVVYERDELFMGLSVGGRKLIPIEAVYGLIEVKSRLDQSTYDAATATLRSVEPLRRFYRWTDQLKQLTDENLAAVTRGVLATDRFLNLGVVWTSIVTFDTVTDQSLAAYLNDAPGHLVFLCVPGQQFIMQSTSHPAKYKGLRVGDNALGIYAWALLDLLAGNSRKRYFAPDLTRYRERFVNALGQMNAWSLNAVDAADP